MSEAVTEPPFDLSEAIKNLVTEDDEPVDNILSEKQQRLLVDALYESWTPPPAEADEGDGEEANAGPRKFWASANVGIFRSVHLPAIVPDMFLSLDVAVPPDLNEHRSYFVWEHGKTPEVVVEIVSNRKGREMNRKRRDYAQMGISYYVAFDPFGHLQEEMNHQTLIVHELGFGKRYRPRNDYRLPEVGLSLTLWEGRFEDCDAVWLRWCDAQDKLLLTGHERAAAARQQAVEAQQRATEAEERAARLAARLRELGINPEEV